MSASSYAAVETARPGPRASGETTIRSAVVFDHVWFAFDEQVVLRDLSFAIPKGSMRILLGPSGAGKSIVLKLILGLIRPDSGRVFVNERRIDTMTERDLIGVRAEIGMLFQESALFDSLSVAENVGYRLYEETDMPADGGPSAGTGSPRVHRPRRVHRPHAVRAVRRPAPPCRHRSRHRRQATPAAVRRSDDGARSDHRRHRQQRNREAPRPRTGHVPCRDASDSRRGLRGDPRGGPGRQSSRGFVPSMESVANVPGSWCSMRDGSASKEAWPS